MSIYGPCIMWNHVERIMYIYDEFHEPAPNKSAIIEHIKNKAKGATVYGNPPMFTEGENIAHIITTAGFMVTKNNRADEGGSLLVLNEMLKRGQLVVHSKCFEVDRQFREWMKENDKPSDHKVGMVKGIMSVITELRDQNVIQPPQEPGPYSQERQRRRQAFKGGRTFQNIASVRTGKVSSSGKWLT